MSTPTVTTQSDVVTAAMGLAKDVAEGRLAPADLERQAVAELRQLFGTVVGEGDPAWEVQTDVARQAIALGALTADELSEWAAVMRRRAGDTLSEPNSDETHAEPESLASEAHSPAAADPEPDDEPEPPALAVVTDPLPALAVVPEPQPEPQRRTEGQDYDALRGWDAGGSRRY